MKRLVIIHRVMGGNTLVYRNENLTKIEDPLQLYEAEIVYFTNDSRPLEIQGNRLFDDTVNVSAMGAITSSLRFVYQGGGQYLFRDEASFFYWSGNTTRIQVAEAKIS